MGPGELQLTTRLGYEEYLLLKVTAAGAICYNGCCWNHSKSQRPGSVTLS